MHAEKGYSGSAGICRDEAGFSMIEVTAAAGILVIATMGLMAAYVSAMSLIGITSETTLASQAARRKVEEMQETAFDTIFAAYNANPDFAVEGLVARDNDPDGFVGKIIFPTAPASPDLLDESFLDRDLGMPRDLNGNDDMVDRISTGYSLLPLRIRIEWQGMSGPRDLEIKTLLTGG